MLTDFKPCPFCGAQPEDPDVGDYFVECPRCGVQGPITNKDGQPHAKEEWNRRAIEAEVLQAQEPKGDPIVELLAAQKPLEPEFAAVMQQCLDETLSEAPDAAPQPPVPCQCAWLEPVAWLHNERKQADVITSAVKKLLTEEKARYGFDSLMQRVKVDKSENYTIPLVRQSDAAAIIAGLRAEVERLTTICADKDRYGIDALQAKVAEQAAEIERQTDFANNFAAQVRQQNETIASLRAEVDHRQSLLRESNRNCAEHAGVVWTQNVTIAQQAERIAELEEENIKRLETSCQQHAKIMEQAALIEKCEKALKAQSFIGTTEALSALAAQKHVVGHHYKSPDTNGFSEEIGGLVTAIAAQKGGA